jgi:Xaa-Pro aminopeptidase
MTINNRLPKLRRRLADNEIDAIIISQPENRHYLSGFNGSAGYLLVTASKAVIATDFRYVEQSQKQAPSCEVFRITNSLADWFPGLVGDLHIKRLGFEAGTVTFDLYRQMKDALNKKQVTAVLVPVTGLAESLRVIKEPGEIERLRKAAAIADAAYEQAEGVIKAGMTEKQAAWEIEKHLREGGSQPVPFEIIVASGPNAALPHARPTERAIRAGEPVVIDMGARFDGYVSDMTRTICAGAPDSTFQKVYRLVLDAQMTALEAISEGMTGHQADDTARAVIQRAGYGEAFGHALGHGIGLETHEAPRLGPNSTDMLSAGMAFTVEPGIYLTGWGGIRIEDTVIISGGRVEALSRARKAGYD